MYRPLHPLAGDDPAVDAELTRLKHLDDEGFQWEDDHAEFQGSWRPNENQEVDPNELHFDRYLHMPEGF